MIKRNDKLTHTRCGEGAHNALPHFCGLGAGPLRTGHDRAHGAGNGKVRRKAEAGNEAHLGAPMPGVVSAVAVSAGQSVKAGDILLSIEAMKMETALHAEKDGTIAEMLVRAGEQIDAKDLLVVFG